MSDSESEQDLSEQEDVSQDEESLLENFSIGENLPIVDGNLGFDDGNSSLNGNSTEDIPIKSTDIFQFREIGGVKIGCSMGASENLRADFLCVSNRFGFLLVGCVDHFLFVKTDLLIAHAKENKSLENSAESIGFRKIFPFQKLQRLALNSEEDIVGVSVDKHLLFYSVVDISDDTVSLIVCVFIINVTLTCLLSRKMLLH
jgi:hypothetical protein